MTRHFCFYDNATGVLHPNRVSTDADPATTAERFAKGSAPPDHTCIEGVYDALSQKVDVTTRKIVDYQPPQPTPDHEWHATGKRWVVKASVTAGVDARATARARIALLEQQSIRACREAQLGKPGAQELLAAIDAEIAAQEQLL